MEHLPIDIVLVRHGESEGNLAQSQSKKGVYLFVYCCEYYKDGTQILRSRKVMTHCGQQSLLQGIPAYIDLPIVDESKRV